MIWNLMEIVGENTTSGRIEIVIDLGPVHEALIGLRMGGVRWSLHPPSISLRGAILISIVTTL